MTRHLPSRAISVKAKAICLWFPQSMLGRSQRPCRMVTESVLGRFRVRPTHHPTRADPPLRESTRATTPPARRAGAGWGPVGATFPPRRPPRADTARRAAPSPSAPGPSPRPPPATAEQPTGTPRAGGRRAGRGSACPLPSRRGHATGQALRTATAFRTRRHHRHSRASGCGDQRQEHRCTPSSSRLLQSKRERGGQSDGGGQMGGTPNRISHGQETRTTVNHDESKAQRIRLWGASHEKKGVREMHSARKHPRSSVPSTRARRRRPAWTAPAEQTAPAAASATAAAATRHDADGQARQRRRP